MNISKSSSGVARFRIRRSHESLSTQLYKVLQGLCVIALMLIVARAASAAVEAPGDIGQAQSDGVSITSSPLLRRAVPAHLKSD